MTSVARTSLAPRRPVEVGFDPFSLGGSRPHMVGIGGCGMSALARVLRDAGVVVTGSDMQASAATVSLGAMGVRVDIDPAPTEALAETDVVIASAAVPGEHPVLVEARARAVPILTYAQALGRCMASRTGVSVAGTHGKSTTTAMLGCALTDAGLDPTVIVGATCAQLTGGALAGPGVPTGSRLGDERIGAGRMAGRPGVLIAEACEYNRSFHAHRPTLASIGAIEPDHLDIYAGIDDIVEAFAGLARLVPDESDGGQLLIAHDGAHRTRVTAGVSCAVRTIGFSPSADYAIAFDPSSRRVSVAVEGKSAGSWVSRMPGEHNATNSATAFALGHMLGANAETLAHSLGAFAGLDRRFQYLGESSGVRVYDDYGHHPTEIDATLRALRQADDPAPRGGRLIAVFQPHQHSRTRFLLDEFATSFGAADMVIVPHIYFVRDTESERAKVSAADLVGKLRARGVEAHHIDRFDAIADELRTSARPGDTVVTMGAGPVWRVARGFLDTAGGDEPGEDASGGGGA